MPYVDFEDYRLANVSVEDLDRSIELFVELAGKYPDHVFLDETQWVKNYCDLGDKRQDLRIGLLSLNTAEDSRGVEA